MTNPTESPQELPPIQYALRFRRDGRFAGLRHSTEKLEDAWGYSAPEIASGCREYAPDVSIEIVPFREYSRPTPPTREVVELEGDVCLKGLKFALQGKDVGVDAWAAGASYTLLLCHASLYGSIAEAAIALADRIRCYRIVGIREVPGAVERYREEVK